jgi:hypothetical protein
LAAAGGAAAGKWSDQAVRCHRRNPGKCMSEAVAKSCGEATADALSSHRKRGEARGGQGDKVRG